MPTDLVIGRIVLSACIALALACLIKADNVAKLTYNFRKRDWHLQESSIPTLARICRVWNAAMLVVLIYLFLALPNFL